MAFKLNGTGSNVTKMYLYPTTSAAAPASRHWEYVSADAATTVDGSGYFSNSTSDGQIALDMLNIGDMIWSFQVASITDTNTIEEDKKAGVTDVSLHVVLDNTGSIIDLSDDILGATVTYGD